MRLDTRVRKPTHAELRVLETHLLHHARPEDYGCMAPGTHGEFMCEVRTSPTAVVEYEGYEGARYTTLMVMWDFVHLAITWKDGVLADVQDYIPWAPSRPCPCVGRALHPAEGDVGRRAKRACEAGRHARYEPGLPGCAAHEGQPTRPETTPNKSQSERR